jgi:hypothetical protein
MGKIITFVSKYSFRSSKQILLHLAFSAAIAAVVFWFGAENLVLKQQGFLPVISAIGAVSGALLAALIAISTFYARYVTDWRDRLVLRLENTEATLRKLIETSAADNPDISRHLGNIYDTVIQYRPGQKVNMDNVQQAAAIFQDWANAEVETKGRPIDLGNIKEFRSFEMQLRDSTICVSNVVVLFWYLWASNNYVSAISIMPSLISGCAITVVISLALAVMGAGSLIPQQLYLPALVIPFWLNIVVIVGCISDFTAMLNIVQVHEKTNQGADEYFDRLKENIDTLNERAG